LPGPLCFHPNFARFNQKEPEVIELHTAGIDAFLKSSQLPVHARMVMLREAMRNIFNLVDLAADLRESTAAWIKAEQDNADKLDNFGLPPEFADTELYIEYYMRLSEMKENAVKLRQRIDVGEDAINRIAVLIGTMLPACTWFQHNSGLAFAVESTYVHDYDRDYTRWKLLICKWEDRGPHQFNK
jgi:hypothetical protein